MVRLNRHSVVYFQPLRCPERVLAVPYPCKRTSFVARNRPCPICTHDRSPRATSILGTAHNPSSAVPLRAFDVPPPAHPTFDLEDLVRRSLEEDSAGIGDITTLATIPAETQVRTLRALSSGPCSRGLTTGPHVQAEATFLAKDDGVVAGLGVATMVFQMVDPSCTVEWSVREGEPVRYGGWPRRPRT